MRQPSPTVPLPPSPPFLLFSHCYIVQSGTALPVCLRQQQQDTPKLTAMTDSANNRTFNNHAAQDRPHPESGPISSHLRRDSRNTLDDQDSRKIPYGSPRTMLGPYPTLQEESRRTSLTASYMPAPPAFPQRQGSMTSSSGTLQQTPRNGSLQGGPSISYAPSMLSCRTAGRMPSATPGNDYLGFCKGAWKLQNNDRPGAMTKAKEAHSWSRNGSKSTVLPQHLRCTSSKCSFRSTLISNDADLIYDKVVVHEKFGLKVRWSFLAKSHVLQKVVLKHQYAFKCLFCTYMGLGAQAAVYVGTDYYLEHVSTDHRGQDLGEVLLYKTSCVNDRVADDSEEFDINLWPPLINSTRQAQQWLDDSLLGDPAIRPNHLLSNSAFRPNEPWIVDINLFDDFDSTQDGSSEGASTIRRSSTPPAYPERHDSVNMPSASDEKRADAFNRDPWRESLDEMWRNPLERGFQPHRQQMVHPAYRQHQRLSSVSESSGYGSTNPTRSASPAMHPGMGPAAGRFSATPSTDTRSRSSFDDAHLGVTMCIDSILQVLTESLAVINELKRQPRFADLETLQDLEDSVRDAPSHIQKEWQRGKSRLGDTFESGDATAIMALQQLTGNLHTRLLGMLRRIFSGSMATDMGFLVDAADEGRHQAITALHDLRTRLTQPAERTRRPFPPRSIANFTPQQGRIQSPTQHLSHLRPDLWKDPYFPEAKARNSSYPTAERKASQDTLGGTTPLSGGTRRRGSVLGLSKSKWSRRMSLSKTSGQEQNEEDAPRPNMKARRVDSAAGDEQQQQIAELDSTPVVR